MIWLDRNENQFGPSPSCMAALSLIQREGLSLYSREYRRGIKSTLSERLAERHGVAEKQVLLSYGSEDMLKQTVHCYLHAGETMLIPRYSWWYYASVAQEVDGRTIEFPLDIADRAFHYNAEAIDALITLHEPRLVLIASPNNPTGNTIARSGLEKLLGLHPETLFILDEAYYGFTGKTQDDTVPLISLYPNLLILRTFSKLFGLAALRIGYAFAGANFKRLSLYSARYLGYNTVSERLALVALEDESYYAQVSATTATENARSCDVLNRFPGVTAYRSEGNFLLIRFPDGAIPALKTSLAAAGIAIKFLDDPDLRSCARITIGTPEQNALLLETMKRCFA
jgi:histidinol-phosphate aminotransferase